MGRAVSSGSGSGVGSVTDAGGHASTSDVHPVPEGGSNVTGERFSGCDNPRRTRPVGWGATSNEHRRVHLERPWAVPRAGVAGRCDFAALGKRAFRLPVSTSNPMTFSTDQLLNIARQYWPSDLESYLRPKMGPEGERLQALWKQELAKMEHWRGFIRALRGELPGFTLGNATCPFDACFRCSAYSEIDHSPQLDWAVIGCVSILAPVYAVYGVRYELKGKQRLSSEVFLESLPDEMRAPSEVIARKIEETFGASAFPRELNEVPVPLFVGLKQPPNTTLFHALFTSEPDIVP